jgi:hypothetical protein
MINYEEYPSCHQERFPLPENEKPPSPDGGETQPLDMNDVRKGRERGLPPRSLAAYAVYFGIAAGASSLGRRTSVLESDPLGIPDLHFGPALHTVSLHVFLLKY